MESVTQQVVEIHSALAAKVNFACQQSSYPVLRDLRIENLSSKQCLEGVVVKLIADPDVIKSRTWRVDRIEPGEIVSIKDRSIDLQGAFLLDLSDAVRGSVTLRVEHGQEILREESVPIECSPTTNGVGRGLCRSCWALFARRTTRLSIGFCIRRRQSCVTRIAQMRSMAIGPEAVNGSGKWHRRSIQPSLISGFPMQCRRRALSEMARRSVYPVRSWMAA